MPALSLLRQEGGRQGLNETVPSRNDPLYGAGLGFPQAIRQLNPGFTVDLAYNVIWGLVAAGDRVTVARTVGGDAYGAAEADGVGFFWTPLWQANGQPADISGGDEIKVYVNAGLAATLNPQDVSGGIDVLTDQVVGTISGDTGGTQVTISVGAEGLPPGQGAPQQTATTNGSGEFAATFAGVDLGPSMLVAVEYPQAGHTVRSYLYPDPRAFVVQNQVNVRGYADPGQQVDVTCFIGEGPDVRWSTGATAAAPHGWYDIYTPSAAQAGDVVKVGLGGQSLTTTVAAMSVTGVDPVFNQVAGTAPPGAAVTVRMWQLGGYAQTTAIADGDGDVSATFATDLRTRDEFQMSVADAEGDESLLLSGAPFVEAYLDPLTNSDAVYWRVDGPGLPITLIIETSSGTYTRTGLVSGAGNGSWPYCNLIRDPSGAPVDFSPGDTITVRSATWEGSLVIADIHWSVDSAANRVSGTAPAGEIDVTANQWYYDQYPIHGSAVETTAGPAFVATFSGFDVRDGGWISARHFDPTSDFATLSNWLGRLATHYFQAYIYYDSIEGVPPTADETVTAYLYDVDGTTLLASTSNDEDGDPWRFRLQFEGYSIEPGRWVTVTASGGWTAGMQVPALTVQADPDTELIWGEGPKSLLFVEHDWPDNWYGRFVPVDGYALDRAFFGGDLKNGDTVYAYYQAVNGDRARAQYSLGELYRVEFGLEADGRTSMWGEAQPGSVVTVTTPLTQVLAWADPSCNGCWDLDAGLVYPGDVVTVAAAPGNYPVVIGIPDPLTAQADSDLDKVWGQIGGWAGQTVEVNSYWDDGYREVIADAEGNYLATYADVPHGAQGHIGLPTQIGDTQVVFHRPFATHDLVMNVNYGDDWVEGDYDPGYTVWLTVTDSFGGVKATVELETQVIPWWGGRTGFSTNLEGVIWNPSRPDIQEGDFVYGRVDRDQGHTGTVRMGTISGTLDLDADTVSGTISAPWFSETLNGWCSVWEENGPSQDFQVDPNGGSYFCDFGALGWDLQAGDSVGVQYREPDGDSVINAFRTKSPNLGLEKWAEGSGQSAPGGPVVFSLRYRNDGDAPATTVYLTDTLPAGTTYVGDSSGVVPVVGADWVAWTLDEPLDPGDQRWFQLVLTNSAGPGDTLHNVADVATLYDNDPGNNHAEADVQVVEGQPDLYVNKNPNPGDPAPGQTMLWEINYGNNGPVASGPVALTDTLPEGTSIVSWMSENDYGLWTDQSTANQLILEAPTLPGGWGDRILLRLQLDPDLEVGTQLTNTVEIATANDANPGDNWHQRNDVWVNRPRWNGQVEKNFGWGRLAPGGVAGYNLNIRNNGNMATSAVLTDTLPAGTTFLEAWQSSPTGDVPFPPDFVGGGLVVWDLGVMEPGQWYNPNIRLALDNGLAPGTVLTNCVDLAIGGDDESPYDNTDCAVETVRDAGPNLRVFKEQRWNSEGQIEYTVNFLNIGTTTLYDVVLTDTPAAGTSFNGNWWSGFWEGIEFSQVGDQLVWTLSRLEPGWSANLRFQVDLDDDLVGQQGLSFVNLVEAPIAGDVNPADNSYQATAYTGPDVYVKKWLKAGELRAGEIVTFTVEFGNQNAWPWNGDPNYGSHITDTLPAEMTFITATAPWNPNEPWQPERIVGNSVVWGWGTMWNNSSWRFDLVAKVSDTVDLGQMLINKVEAYGDSPNDIEPNYDNNVFELSLRIGGTRIYLPMVFRNH